MLSYPSSIVKKRRSSLSSIARLGHTCVLAPTFPLSYTVCIKSVLISSDRVKNNINIGKCYKEGSVNVLFLTLVDRMLPFLLNQKDFSMGVWDVIIITAVREVLLFGVFFTN